MSNKNRLERLSRELYECTKELEKLSRRQRTVEDLNEDNNESVWERAMSLGLKAVKEYIDEHNDEMFLAPDNFRGGSAGNWNYSTVVFPIDHPFVVEFLQPKNIGYLEDTSGDELDVAYWRIDLNELFKKIGIDIHDSELVYDHGVRMTDTFANVLRNHGIRALGHDPDTDFTYDQPEDSFDSSFTSFHDENYKPLKPGPDFMGESFSSSNEGDPDFDDIEEIITQATRAAEQALAVGGYMVNDMSNEEWLASDGTTRDIRTVGNPKKASYHMWLVPKDENLIDYFMSMGRGVEINRHNYHVNFIKDIIKVESELPRRIRYRLDPQEHMIKAFVKTLNDYGIDAGYIMK